MAEGQESAKPRFIDRIREAIKGDDVDGLISVLQEFDKALSGKINENLTEGSEKFILYRNKLQEFMNKVKRGEDVKFLFRLGDETSDVEIFSESGNIFLNRTHSMTTDIHRKWSEVR